MSRIRRSARPSSLPTLSRSAGGHARLLADDLEPQFQRREVLAQPVVQLARDAPPLGLLCRDQAAEHLAMGLLGALALGDLGLQGLVGLGQLGGPFPDAHFQLIALALQAGFRLLESASSACLRSMA